MKSGSIHIRKATPRDVLDVQSCARAAFAKYIERIGREPAPMNADFASQIDRSLVYVAEVNGDIAGYVVSYVDGKHVHLENVAVWPEYAGQGIGGSMIAFVEDYGRIERKEQDGFHRVFFRKSL